MVALILFVIALIVLAIIGLSSIRTVEQYERGVVFRFGKIVRVLDPGLNLVTPFIDRVDKINMQVQSRGLEAQEVVTKDSVSLQILVVVYFRIVDAIKVFDVEDEDDAIEQLAQAIMRKVVGQHPLEEVLSHSNSVVEAIKTELGEDTQQWGLCVDRIEIKDVTLPEGMKRAMASQAESQREAAAKVTAAQGELDSAERLQQAAAFMSPAALELRRLQTYREIGADNAAIIVVTADADQGNLAGTAAAGHLAAEKVTRDREQAADAAAA